MTGATQITCTTPAHAASAVDVVVTNADTQAGTLAGGFTYNAASGGAPGTFRFLTTEIPTATRSSAFSFTPALGYRKTAFAAASAKVSVKAATKDSLSFSMLLGNPAFVYPAGQAPNEVKTVQFKLYNSAGTLVANEDFTNIVTFTVATDKATGAKVYKLKRGKDATAPIGKFTYDSKSGKMMVSLKGMTLTGLLSATEEQVSVEMDIADKQYYTGVTLFAPKAGSYSTRMP